jgi:hypothetical protein
MWPAAGPGAGPGAGHGAPLNRGETSRAEGFRRRRMNAHHSTPLRAGPTSCFSKLGHKPIFSMRNSGFGSFGDKISTPNCPIFDFAFQSV